jgi:hypothetical protein
MQMRVGILGMVRTLEMFEKKQQQLHKLLKGDVNLWVMGTVLQYYWVGDSVAGWGKIRDIAYRYFAAKFSRNFRGV